MLTSEDDAAEILRKNLNDKNWRLNNLYWIKDKNGRKVKFVHNPVQKRYNANKHNRNINLKARQQGFTTDACIDSLDDALFNPYFDAGIIAHTVQDAEKIFTNKVKFAYDELPQWLRNIRPASTDRAGELRFNNGSSISVSTGYRGGTLMKLHVSEFGKICAKYPDKAEEIVTGAFNAVPMNGQITIESTAEGMTGHFFDMCEKSQNNDKENLTPLDFKFHFFAWWESEEYRLNPSGIEISADFAKYFKDLKENQDIVLDDHQKAWYVKKSQEQGEGMHQEYPSFPEEAFRASGRPVFNLEKIGRDIKRAKLKTPEIKNFSIKGLDRELVVPVKIFHHPKIEDAYAVAGDPAEGLQSGDNSALSVLDKKFRQCASYAGKLDPDLFGRLMVAVAKYFNGAIVAPELNNHGHAVVNSIKSEKYYKIFKREVKEELGQDVLDKVGWLNTVKTKMEMLDELKKAYRDDSLEVNDEATLREMMSCVTEENGDIVVNGKDRVVCLGISIQAIKQASNEGEHRAFVPGQGREKDVTKMSINEKMAYYKRIGK